MADLAHRKASKKIQFVGKDGKPVCNANVQVELKKHDFLFMMLVFIQLDSAK